MKAFPIASGSLIARSSTLRNRNANLVFSLQTGKTAPRKPTFSLTKCTSKSLFFMQCLIQSNGISISAANSSTQGQQSAKRLIAGEHSCELRHRPWEEASGHCVPGMDTRARLARPAAHSIFLSHPTQCAFVQRGHWHEIKPPHASQFWPLRAWEWIQQSRALRVIHSKFIWSSN